MKFMALAALLLTGAAFAGPISLPGEDYVLNDIAQMGLKKEVLFSKMDRQFIKLGDSICANRAQMWTYEFKRQHNIDAAKMFLFYTMKSGEGSRKDWWYHVTPVINENGAMWTMDAGFGGIKSPLKFNDWFHYFVGSANCKEIKDSDVDLIERMFKGMRYPDVTSYGAYDCYYRVVPATYWFPSHVATHLLGRNEEGRPTRLERTEFDVDEVFQACVEATTGPMNRWLGGGKKQCKEWLGM